MTVTATARISPRLPFMPCCGRNAGEGGNVKVTGWVLIPERITCGCGAVWTIVDHHEADDESAYSDIKLESLPEHPLMRTTWDGLPHAVRALLALRLASADLTWLIDKETMRPFLGHLFLPDLLGDVVRAQALLHECLSADETAAYRTWRDKSTDTETQKHGVPPAS